MTMLERLLKRELYRKSFYEFVKAFWSYADPAPFIDSDLIEYYCEVFQYMTRKWWDYKNDVKIDLHNLDGTIIDIRSNKNNLNLVVPPRHSKSMIFNVMGAVWLWTFQPVKIASVSHTGQLANEMNSKRHKIINSSLFKELYSDITLIANTTTLLRDNRGGELYSINRNAFTGYGADIIINDDLTNAEAARKDQAEMNNAWSYYQNTMPSRINNLSKYLIINIQQRLAPNDITGHILSDNALKKQYMFITLPAIFSETTHLIYPISGKIKTFNKGDVLWKSRFGDYKKIRYQVGESVFETQYLQNPIASDKTTLKENQFVLKNITEVPDISGAELIFASHDFPIKDKEDSDFMGSVIAYRVNQTLYITDCLEKKMAFVKSVEYVKVLSEKYKGIIQIIEDKANGSPILQQLQDVVTGLVAYNPKTASKTQRLESASLYMESKNIVFVKDEWDEANNTYELSSNLQNLKTRLLNFPFVKHDDIVDAFSMLVLYVFMEKRNNVYARSFNNDNIISYIPSNINQTYFINKEGNYFKINKIGIDYHTNTLYVVDELEVKDSIENTLNDLKANNPKLKYIIDTSDIPLIIHNKDIMIDRYSLPDFHKSTMSTEVLFSRNRVLINKECKRTIADIENFKWLTNKDEEVKYITEKDGFIKNIRTAIKYYGVLI